MIPLQKVAFEFDISASSGANSESAVEFVMMQDFPSGSIVASYISSYERVYAQHMGLLS